VSCSGRCSRADPAEASDREGRRDGLGIPQGVDQVPEERLQAGERGPTNHDHAGVEITDDSLWDHLAFEHMTVPPEGLSFGALRGMHDRFHGESHAADE
jgi:hypothetical protein